MTIATSSVASETTTPFHGLVPLQAPPTLQLTSKQFSQLSAENSEAVLELAADGIVIVMAPTGIETGTSNLRLEMRLLLWADHHVGWRVFGSSTGFGLPEPSMVRCDRLLALSSDDH